MQSLAAVVLVLAFALGFWTANIFKEDPDPVFIKVPQTKIIHEPAPPPERVAYVPQACLLASRMAGRISKAADKMYNTGDRQLEIISAVREALASGGDISALENRQRRLRSNTIGHLWDASNDLSTFQHFYKDCKEQTE